MLDAVPRSIDPDRVPSVSHRRFESVTLLKHQIWQWFRTTLVVGATLLLGAVPPPAVPISPAPIAAAPIKVELVPAIALSHRANHLMSAFRSGDPVALRAAVQEVELLRRTYGTLDVLPLVEAMAIFARQMGEEGRPELGLEVVHTMETWAPRYPTLLGTRVILMRQQGFTGYLWSMAEVFELTRLRLTHPVHVWLWVIQHSAWLRLMVTLLLWGWALTMGLRYRRVFRDLWEEPLGRKGLSTQVVALLGAFLITLPVILGMDPNLVAMLWLWLLAPFLLHLEVRVSVLVLALQLLHPALALLEPMAARAPQPSIVTLQLRPQPLMDDLKMLSALPSGDQAFLAGWRALQVQDWPEAEAIFNRLLPTHPNRAEVLNNLGVARFQAGNLAGAQTAFDAAYLLNPSNPEVLINQSVVAFRQMDSTVGAGKQEEARHANPATFTQLLTANQARVDQRTFGTPLPDSPKRIQVLATGYGLARGGAGGVKPLAILLSLLLPLAALGAFLLRVRRSITDVHPSQCTRCGDPFHTTDSPDVFVCSKCHHLFVLKDGLHGESRKKKVDEVATFQASQRWIHRLLMVVLPGADRCFLGDTRDGLVEFLFLCFALGIVLATGQSVRYPGEILADPASAWLPVGIALLGVLFLRSWFKLLPRRS